jgi:plasmid replication initiation protein
MILVMDNGIGASGQQLSKNRIYKNLKTNASNDSIHTVAQAVVGLQDKVNLAIQRRDTVELEAE